MNYIREWALKTGALLVDTNPDTFRPEVRREYEKCAAAARVSEEAIPGSVVTHEWANMPLEWRVREAVWRFSPSWVGFMEGWMKSWQPVAGQTPGNQYDPR
jgi:hypothetical protein